MERMLSGVFNCSGHETVIPDVVGSDGVYVVDAQGKKYMDLESGVWCTSLGHRNTRITNIIKQQTDALMHAGFCYSSEVVGRAAKAVLSITNLADGGCVFLCSGSESVELARQISRAATGRALSMTLHDSFLGSYSSTTDKTRGWHLFDWTKCARCPERDSCSPDCDQLRNIPPDVSEFVFEPGSSSGFVRFPPKAMILNIVDIVRGNGGKIVANEVTTGIGRTGAWFGFNHYGIEPDMIAMGKGLGNGYPVSATAINRPTIEQVTKTSFKYYQSHQNDPLGASVANEVLTVIKDEGLLAKAAANGEKLLEKLQALVDGVTILDVRGRGLMLAVDICDAGTGDIIYEKLLARGYIVCNRKSLLRIDPPLTVSERELDSFVDAFQDVLQTL